MPALASQAAAGVAQVAVPSSLQHPNLVKVYARLTNMVEVAGGEASLRLCTPRAAPLPASGCACVCACMRIHKRARAHTRAHTHTHTHTNTHTHQAVLTQQGLAAAVTAAAEAAAARWGPAGWGTGQCCWERCEKS